MRTYIISGKFKMGENKKQPFKIEIQANNQDTAKEKIFCEIGARHRCPRRFIKIEKIEETLIERSSMGPSKIKDFGRVE